MFNHAAAIGVDIGRNSIKIAVVKISGEVIATKSFPLNQIQTRDYIISMLLQAISDIRKSVALEDINPICIGTAAKGFIDHTSGIVLGPDQGIRDWTNVPLAIIINGKLYRGVNNAGGEVGQMIINFDNGISDKGIRGSYEHFASATAIVRRYAEEIN